MTGYWRKLFGKIVDTMFTFKGGCCVWHESMYEPLTIAFLKTFLLRPPWKIRHLPAVDRWEKSMLKMQWNGACNLWNHMRKF